MSISKLERSIKAHERLMCHHEDLFRSTSIYTPKSFWSDVKRDYHRVIYMEQRFTGKLLTQQEKKDIFNRKLKFTIDSRKAVNKQTNANQYIPKKYKK